jgi:hypothetical protein
MRKAFENQFFDMKALHLNLSGYVRVQWSLRGRQSAQHLEKVLAHLLLNSSQVLFGSNAFPSFAALVILAPRHFGLISQIVSYRRSMIRIGR